MKDYHLTELDLSLIYQMDVNLKGIARNAEHPHEILTVLLIRIIAMLYSGTRGKDGHHKADIQKLITEFDAGNVGSFEDLLIEIARETENLKKLKGGETIPETTRTISIDTIEKEEDV